MRLISRAQTGAMSFVIRAILSMAVVIVAAVVMASGIGTLADVLGGIAVLVAILVFTRAIMDFAAEPAEDRQRSGRRR